MTLKGVDGFRQCCRGSFSSKMTYFFLAVMMLLPATVRCCGICQGIPGPPSRRWISSLFDGRFKRCDLIVSAFLRKRDIGLVVVIDSFRKRFGMVIRAAVCDPVQVKVHVKIAYTCVICRRVTRRQMGAKVSADRYCGASERASFSSPPLQAISSDWQIRKSPVRLEHLCSLDCYRYLSKWQDFLPKYMAQVA